MTKKFNETCVCNNGLDGTNTCEFVEKKYDLVRFQCYSIPYSACCLKESCVHWIDTYFGKPIPTTVNPWDARGDIMTEEPVYIGKVYDLLQTAPGVVRPELDGRNGITIAWNKSIQTDDNVCYRVQPKFHISLSPSTCLMLGSLLILRHHSIQRPRHPRVIRS